MSEITTYELTIEHDGGDLTIEARDLADARRQAADWVREGDYGVLESTIWVRCAIDDPDDEDALTEWVTVSIDPDEPPCRGGEVHDWQSPHDIVGGIEDNPGVWGNGGGVVIHECCMLCGCARVTDTWAQDRETGRQGLHSVSYEPGKYAEDLVHVEAE